MMDRRSIIFVLSVVLSFFLISKYSDWKYEKELHQWNIEQQGNRQKKLQKLTQNLAEKTARPDQLPLVSLYADDKGNLFLTTGVLVDKTMITLPWSEEAVKTVFVRSPDAEEALMKLQLAYDPERKDSPLIYQESDKEPLHIGNLPDIGSEDLQVVMLSPKDKTHPFEILAGTYTDGSFSFIQDQIEQVKKELNEEYQPKELPEMSGIALMKFSDKYLPVAIYQPHQKRLVYLEDLAALRPLVAKTEEKTGELLPKLSKQQYYVLENEYQQLVFSNVGAALAEINLPFKSKTNDVSVVRPIEFDKEIQKDHPYNAYFPAHPYQIANANGELQEHAQGTLGGYYPLLRRDLIEPKNKKSILINPRYYGLNLLSEYPEVAELVYKVKSFNAEKIVFEAQQQHRKITKTFSLSKDKTAPYCFNVSITIEGDKRGLWLSSGVPEVELFSGSPAPALKYRMTHNRSSSINILTLPDETNTPFTNNSTSPDWICNSNGFFGILIDPLTEVDAGFRATYVKGQTVPSRLVEIDQANNLFDPATLPGYMMMIPLKIEGNKMDFRIFAGPFSDAILNSVDKTYSDAATGYNPDYISSQSDHGWFSFISEPFAAILFVLMNFFHKITDSWGFSIILLTVSLRIFMYPLNAWSTKSMILMQQIAPEVAAIQERHKKDPKEAQIAIMNLYRERGVNPLSGCFPMLLQMPFLIGMFDLLKTTFELRGASFIPGWIDNLTSPDVLFSWQTPVFFFGNQFHLLPILLGAVMFAQQRMFSAQPKDPSQMTEQQRQQRSMGTMMTGIFAVMFYHFPSGLNIYWLSSMLLGILQQWWMQRRMENMPVPQIPVVTKAKGK